MNKLEASKTSKRLWLLGVVVLGLVLKLAILVANVVPFNSDESIVALMASHILQGERPIFFYGQAYMGSLDAWLVALGFSIFGEGVWVIRLVQSLLYAGTILTTVLIGHRIFPDKRVGYFAGLLLAIPTINVTLYTTATLGGYGEALLIGNFLILTGLEIGEKIKTSQRPAWHQWLVFGFLSGLGLWSLSLSLVFAFPVVIYLLVLTLRFQISMPGRALQSRLAPIGLLFCGGLIGSSPWWIFAVEHGFDQLIHELSGSAISGVEGLSVFAQWGQHLLNFLIFGSSVIMGLRPPWSITWLGLPLAPFALAIWLAVFVWISKSTRRNDELKAERNLLLGVMLTLTAVFILSPFGADPSGRYFLPFAIPLVLFASELTLWLRVRVGNIALGLIAVLLVFNLWGVIESVQRDPPGITTQFDEVSQVDQEAMTELIDFLIREGETRGYTNYWVSYPLAYLSDERIIYVPWLPYHRDFRYTPRDDRYPPYDRIVDSSSRVAYITTRFPELDKKIRDRFTALDITWREAEIGDFQIFYDLSDRVEPGDIGLGPSLQ
jgi:4-amino-4-deoxy-L-arabinose transferase-like glycosyltransferase